MTASTPHTPPHVHQPALDDPEPTDADQRATERRTRAQAEVAAIKDRLKQIDPKLDRPTKGRR